MRGSDCSKRVHGGQVPKADDSIAAYGYTDSAHKSDRRDNSTVLREGSEKCKSEEVKFLN